jgi:transposase
MSRTSVIDQKVVERARDIMATKPIHQDALMALSVLLPATMGATIFQTAAALCISTSTVTRLQSEIRNQGLRKKNKGSWGGRRRQTMTLEEEKEFLVPWIEQAKVGGVLTVPPLHQALEKRIGHPVSPSTMYRLLARHGWRKVQPDTYHPKSDPQAQEDFKKNFETSSWKWFPLRGDIR